MTTTTEKEFADMIRDSLAETHDSEVKSVTTVSASTSESNNTYSSVKLSDGAEFVLVVIKAQEAI